jgi:tetratricopeptide (TPR) repeat protein/DNA-binding XRE family transcriptional regulator
MRTFSELLREYIARTGVSDAELARAVGVQRQTIFRWKEGLVARPRSAEEVLRLAEKLRLTPAERDELLLAAGFPPVRPPENLSETSAPRGTQIPAADAVSLVPASNDPGETTAEPQLALAPDRAPRLRGAVLAAWLFMLLLGSAALFVALRQPRYPQAAPGETLIVVAQFGNYTAGAQGYNVAGRLGEALARELTAAGLSDARVTVWPEPITDEQTAEEALARSRAGLLVWGEYDSGRVVARFLQRDEAAAGTRELSVLAATPAELPAVINAAVPGDMRYFALYSLAQIYLHAENPGAARAALGQAGLNLPEDPNTQAAHHFLWGYAHQVGEQQKLDVAIQAYTDALMLDDSLEVARNNRAIAYLKRLAPGDAQAAIEDLSRFLETQRDDPAALNNRGSAYFFLGGKENARRALEDFNRVVALAPDDLAGYYNRGLARIRLDQGAEWRADLHAALEGEHPQAAVALCWGYSLSEEPQAAVGYCRQAAEGGDAGSWENLGVALARNGQFAEARVALEMFRATPQGAAKAEELERWMTSLDQARDPFDAETLRRLREE